MTFSSIVIAALLAGGAAAKDSKPDWVKGPSRAHPRATHLTAVGFGESRAVAEERARGELSKIFSSVVTVETGVSTTEGTKEQGGKASNSFSQTVFQTVQTASQMALEGVEIPENWQDSDTRQHYSLAVLERSKAVLAVEEKLGELDEQAKEWKTQMDQASAKLPRVKAAMKVAALLKARETLNAQHRVLDASGKSVPAPFNAAQARAAASKALSELEVVVDFSCDAASGAACGREVETGVIQGLNRFGFQARLTQSAEPDILVEGPVATVPMDGDGTPWKYGRSSVTVSLKDGRTGRVILQFEASERAAAREAREAARRSRAGLAKKVAKQAHEAVVSYFENQ